MTGPVLGLDLGRARIGVAVSDPDRTVALPAGTLRVVGGVEDLRAVAALVERHEATEVVVGHPLSLSGERGPSARHAEEFARGLEAMLDVPVHLHDERLSTVEAERGLAEAGVRGAARRRASDQAAASIILRSWLAAQEG